MILILATNNKHKRVELQALWPEVQLLIPQDVGLAHWDHEETADSFIGNALGKARALWKDLGGRYTTIADDSGLCVKALNDGPGIYSARFGQKEEGQNLTDQEKNILLLKLMEPVVDRSAYFVSALALVRGLNQFTLVQESWEGEITRTFQGAQGFGYDPIFYIPILQKTAAELTLEEKNEFSHRGKAAKRIKPLFKDLKE